MFFEPGGLPFPLVGTSDSGSTVSAVVPMRSVELPIGGGLGKGCGPIFDLFDDSTEIAGEPDQEDPTAPKQQENPTLLK